MKIILRNDFESLGFEGDTIDVARGYARNFLIPKGVAIEATDGNLKALEMRKDKIMAKHMKNKEEAERAAEKISHITVTISRKAGEKGKLYGSVTSRDITEALEQEGISVDRRKIITDEAIRTLGEFEVSIKLYSEVMAKMKVIVAKEGEKA